MKIAVFGAGGFGREIACLIREINAAGTQVPFDFVGFFDDDPALKSVPQGKILGTLQDLNAVEEPLAVVIALGNPRVLRRVRERLDNPRLSFPNLISPRAHFLERDTVRMGCGNVIQAGVDISCNVTLGNFNLFNLNATAGHDLVMGDCNVCLTGARLSGNVSVGDANLFGSNSVVCQGVPVGNETSLAACSFAVAAMTDGKTYIGVPAKILKL
ncbi:MAG: hypothetical protein K6B46_04220 [Opitutales bacterium]|nr:hypothetical protein [Opitutales bacterium]